VRAENNRADFGLSVSAAREIMADGMANLDQIALPIWACRVRLVAANPFACERFQERRIGAVRVRRRRYDEQRTERCNTGDCASNCCAPIQLVGLGARTTPQVDSRLAAVTDGAASTRRRSNTVRTHHRPGLSTSLVPVLSLSCASLSFELNVGHWH
jgi:hypothetical protein